jgi:hypothetical protein
MKINFRAKTLKVFLFGMYIENYKMIHKFDMTGGEMRPVVGKGTTIFLFFGPVRMEVVIHR